MICFILPLLFAIFKGNKAFCNRYCDRGQLLGLIGGRLAYQEKEVLQNGCIQNILDTVF